jgi:hypothetical protein
MHRPYPGGPNMKRNRVLGFALAVLISQGWTSASMNAYATSEAPRAMLRAGTSLRLRLNEAIDTKRNRVGDLFTATLAEPLVSGDRVVVPKGTRFRGHVTEAKSSGRFKGRAILALRLDSLELNGRSYAIQSAASRTSGAHKRRNWAWIGGTSGGGALIGAAAAGGAGALIGAGAGAAAGTVGAAITGRKQVNLPVESRVTFLLRSDLSLSR